MKVATSAAYPRAFALTRVRAADYLELTKPRLTVMVLFTVGVGAVLGQGGVADVLVLLHTVLGTALVAAGASALNQWLERRSDALMARTENRPLPAGRLTSLEVLVFGVGLTVAGLVDLAIGLQRPLAALIAAITFLSYVLIYTPLKRITPLNTLIGAVPGALPPVIGWTAVRDSLGIGDLAAVALFAIVFFWQVPHFLAIAWIYRDDYARAGLPMLPVVDRAGNRTSRAMILNCLALLAVSLAAPLLGVGGLVSLIGAMLLGLGFLRTTIGFARTRSIAQARQVLRASLVYLPCILALLVVDHLFIAKPLLFWR